MRDQRRIDRPPQPDPLPPGTGSVRAVGHSLTPAEKEISGARTMLQSEDAKPTLAAATASNPGASRAPLLFGGALAVLGAIVAAVLILRPTAQSPLPVALAPLPIVSVTASAPLVAAPPATVVPAPVGIPAEVEITVDSTPKDVEIYLGKEKLGTSAKPLHLKRSDDEVKLTFKAPGHAPQEMEIAPAADSHVAIALVKIGGGARQKPGGGDLEY